MRTSAIFAAVRQEMPKLPTLLRGGAWLFAAGSLVPLLWLASEGGIGSGGASVFRASGPRGDHSVWLLNYHGWLGTALLWSELIVIAAAIAATGWKIVPLRWRRVGHGVLIGWNALWMLGVLRLGFINPGLWTIQGLFIAALMACTIDRARRGWNGPEADSASSPNGGGRVIDEPEFSTPAPTGAADEFRLLTAEEVRPSGEMRELRSPRLAMNYFAEPPKAESPARKWAKRAAQTTKAKSRIIAGHIAELGRQAGAAIRAKWASLNSVNPPPRA